MNRLFNPVVSDFPYAYTLASPLLSSSDFAPVALASTITVRIVRLSTVTPLKIYQWPVVTALSMSALVDTVISVILCVLFRRMSHQAAMYVFVSHSVAVSST